MMNEPVGEGEGMEALLQQMMGEMGGEWRALGALAALAALAAPAAGLHCFASCGSGAPQQLAEDGRRAQPPVAGSHLVGWPAHAGGGCQPCPANPARSCTNWRAVVTREVHAPDG